MVNHYKYVAVFLVLWRFVDFFKNFTGKDNHVEISLIEEERVKNSKHKLNDLEEKLKNIDLIVQNLE